MDFLRNIFEWTFHLEGFKLILWNSWIGFQIIPFLYFLIGPIVMYIEFDWYTKNIHWLYHFIIIILYLCLFVLIGYIGYLNIGV